MSMGLCVTPQFYPTSTELKELNPSFLRSILYRLSDLDVLVNTDRKLVITLNNQCAEVRNDWSGWDETVLRICNRFRNSDQLQMLIAGNEFDIYWNENGSVPPEFGADLSLRTARICNNYCIKSAATSVAGPKWQEYLEIMANLCSHEVEYFDVHPYGQRPKGFKPNIPLNKWFHGELVNFITRARQLCGREVIVSEYGVKIKDAGSEDDVADFMMYADLTLMGLKVPYISWFAYTDFVGAPSERGDEAFGLSDETNRHRPAWDVFSEVNQGMQPAPDKWTGKVGNGLLEMMRADQTEPSMPSEWRPFDRPSGQAAKVEYCIAANGTHYYWLLDQNKGYRLLPS